ncbi:MAG: NAD(P)/FAD-dependent oxidoreductase [Spirochaetaceae bacterium]|nr:MAG: NAD(P)/FAD-dependent oxidoreductase [Spirochaetaceae bacterium]
MISLAPARSPRACVRKARVERIPESASTSPVLRAIPAAASTNCSAAEGSPRCRAYPKSARAYSRASSLGNESSSAIAGSAGRARRRRSVASSGCATAVPPAKRATRSRASARNPVPPTVRSPGFPVMVQYYRFLLPIVEFLSARKRLKALVLPGKIEDELVANATNHGPNRLYFGRMERSLIIIGAGLTGLATGCYGRMNGYRTTLFEMHGIPGGVCTAWTRKGYTIDGAVNWVLGTRPDGMFHHFWEELGLTRSWTIHEHDRSLLVEDHAGRQFTFWCDADRMERYMLEISPEDTATIREFTGAVRRASRFTMPMDKPQELYGLPDLVRMVGMLPMLWFMKRWSRVLIGDFAARFRSPFIREVFSLAFPADTSIFMLIMVLAWQHRRTAGYVVGGALPLVRSIEERYLSLGGRVHYNTRVEKILVRDDRAVGVKLADGSEHHADWIVSAADGRTTIFDMLAGRYVDGKITARYENPKLFRPLVYVAIGVSRELDALPPAMQGLIYPLERPLLVGESEERLMCVRSYCFDPTLAPEGKTVLVVQFETDYEWWATLRKDPERYRAEKERIAADVITGLEQRFPGISAHVEMIDVATPITWERYTGNWRGAYEGWIMDADSFTTTMKKTLPGLDNFYMAGQWVNPGGGIPTAIMSGNHTIQLICRRDGRKFTVR